MIDDSLWLIYAWLISRKFELILWELISRELILRDDVFLIGSRATNEREMSTQIG